MDNDVIYSFIRRIFFPLLQFKRKVLSFINQVNFGDILLLSTCNMFFIVVFLFVIGFFFFASFLLKTILLLQFFLHFFLSILTVFKDYSENPFFSVLCAYLFTYVTITLIFFFI